MLCCRHRLPHSNLACILAHGTRVTEAVCDAVRAITRFDSIPVLDKLPDPKWVVWAKTVTKCEALVTHASPRISSETRRQKGAVNADAEIGEAAAKMGFVGHTTCGDR